MPYIPVALAFLLFTLAGMTATLVCAVGARFNPFLAYVWRAWLGGTLGFVVANAILGGIFAYSIYGVGVASGAEVRATFKDTIITIAVILGPLVASAIGVAVGVYLGLRSARRVQSK